MDAELMEKARTGLQASQDGNLIGNLMCLDRDRVRHGPPLPSLGANASPRLSMCQIASESRRARSIWATLAPRCLPMRVLVCW